jgi:hypothetical protein
VAKSSKRVAKLMRDAQSAAKAHQLLEDYETLFDACADLRLQPAIEAGLTAVQEAASKALGDEHAFQDNLAVLIVALTGGLLSPNWKGRDPKITASVIAVVILELIDVWAEPSP